MHSLPLHLGKKLSRGKAAQFRGRGRRNQMKPVICSGIYIGNNTVPDILPTLSGARKNYFHGFPRQERAAKETGLQVYTDAGEPQFVTTASRRKFCAAQSKKRLRNPNHCRAAAFYACIPGSQLSPAPAPGADCLPRSAAFAAGQWPPALSAALPAAVKSPTPGWRR